MLYYLIDSLKNPSMPLLSLEEKDLGNGIIRKTRNEREEKTSVNGELRENPTDVLFLARLFPDFANCRHKPPRRRKSHRVRQRPRGLIPASSHNLWSLLSVRNE